MEEEELKEIIKFIQINQKVIDNDTWIKTIKLIEELKKKLEK